MKVPPATIFAHSVSYSCCEPSTQWIEDGFVSWAIFSTQRNRCLFELSGRVALWTSISLVVSIMIGDPSVVVRFTRWKSDRPHLPTEFMDLTLTGCECLRFKKYAAIEKLQP